MITNIYDYMSNEYGQIVENKPIHIPDHPNYAELAFPYTIEMSNGTILDANGDFAIFTVDLLNSYNWEIVEE